MGDLVLGKQKGLFWGDRVGGGGGHKLAPLKTPSSVCMLTSTFNTVYVQYSPK